MEALVLSLLLWLSANSDYNASGAYARFDCPAQGEFDAYRLGGIYLRQLGVPDPLPGRMVWMRRYSAC
jgi:hypothetical protein